ncbi:unnamed protein product [Ilex paraguariensis]|uniref:Glutaredoxin domain-containing protein n=1 Tax=Ilex paraguariensis TaxID=185542 RepID=A0ABC8TAX6_9AQUA
MWLSRRKSIPRTPSNSSNFSFSSFKDIQSLCAADYVSDPQHPQPKKPSSIFHRVRLANLVLRSLSTQRRLENASPSNDAVKPSEPSISLQGAENRIVVYFTSLRVVRSTFEDCNTVRTILRGFRVKIDERDLSMDPSFLEELQRILGQLEKTKLTLPRVFIGGRYIGGADEIRQLHETGELKKFVEGLPAAQPGTCEACGGYRFVLCDECSGSHKCYSEKIGFKSCTACNENGLIRCPSCSSGPL